MRTIAAIVLASLLAAARAGQDVITNAAELAALERSAGGVSRKFELTGTILTSYPHLLKSGDTTLRVTGDIYQDRLKPGDVVFMRGLTRPGDFNFIYALNAEVVGTTSIPRPELASAADLLAADPIERLVTLRGRATLVFQDELDPEYVYLVLDCAGTTVFAATTAANVPIEKVPSLEGAELEVCGSLVRIKQRVSQRAYMGSLFKIWQEYPVKIVKPAESDPAAFPGLPPLVQISPKTIAAIGRRRISGCVLAVWPESQLLMRSDDGMLHRVSLSTGQRLPGAGDRVVCAGEVETDLYCLNLSRAICRIDRSGAQPLETADGPTPPEDILSNERGELMIKPAYGGKVVRIRGVLRPAASADSGGGLQRFELDCGRHIVPVVIGNSCDLSSVPDVGSKVDVTGCCVMDVDNWLPNRPFPRIRGIFVVTRTSGDIVLVSRPAWWTLTRFIVVLASTLAVLVGFLIWNQILRRLVEKRSKELADEQVAHAKSEFRTMERTNLAIELHDTLSQDLAAVSCQIAASTIQFHTNPAEALKNLATSETMLHSCRTELKRCLWDLRNNTLEDADMTHAIMHTLESLAGGIRLAVRFNVPRDCLTDTSVHALLCIVRELVSNAIVHGKAANVKVAGYLEGATIRFSVVDDGVGFDPRNYPGPDTGHFGLAGIQTRIKRLHGKLEVESARNRGTRVAVTLSIAEPKDA